MENNKLNYFRPKARHIFTIGRDLIKDDFSALIELVKNSYDADASKIDIKFKEHKGKIEIIISDDGHGMSENDIRTKWLIPSTDNKVGDRESPKGRIFQGQKGIGRYAASVLGFDLEMKTISNGIETTVNINWDDFSNSNKFLDEIHLDIVTKKIDTNNGTIIRIFGDEEKLSIWKNESKQKKFKLELEKLKPPFDTEDNFLVNLNFFGADEPIDNKQFLDYFDYSVEGEIDEEGKTVITYFNNDTKKEEIIDKKLKLDFKDDDGNLNLKYPGKIKFKLLVLDLDPIDKRNSISRQFGRILSNRGEQKRYYEKYAGVSIYRGGFRIRPYGEKYEDWLQLNMRRVNNPTLRVSTNQLLGYIRIGNEDDSNLIEASSREKLKENEYFYGLVYELRQIIGEIELKRFKYRGEVGLREKAIKSINIEEKITKLEEDIKDIDSEKDKDRVIKSAQKLGESFNRETARLEKIITQYEGQVTLGKLLSITFHEVSKPTKFMKENIKNVKFYIDKIESKLIGGLGEFGENILNLLRGYEINAKVVSDFMSNNLQPLVKGKGKPSYFVLNNILKHSTSTFSNELIKCKIKVEIIGERNLYIYGYERDFLVAFTNFIDNSIYWLNESKNDNKLIQIEIKDNGNNLEIYFKDNGFGILNIADIDDILEPGFSRKEDGTGLGLSIAGEVLNDNNVGLKIIGTDESFNFILKLVIKKWKK